MDHLRQYLSTNGPVNFMRDITDKVRVHDGYIALLDGGSANPHFDNLDTRSPEQANEGVAECYWIIPEAMQRILANHNRKATLDALVAMGALLSEKNKAGEIDYNPRKNDPVFNRRRRYYRIDANALFS